MITLKRILTPTDFSTISVPAIGYALSLAKQLDAEVTVLHALPKAATKGELLNQYAAGDLAGPGTLMSIGSQPNFDDIFERKKRVLISFLEERISKDLLRAVKVNPVIKAGKVTEEIVAVAKEEQCDLIVMTSHGVACENCFTAALPTASFVKRPVRCCRFSRGRRFGPRRINGRR
jgi:nucleotide-binding universal stress UspA family protein